MPYIGILNGFFNDFGLTFNEKKTKPNRIFMLNVEKKYYRYII